ncbi:MAG: aminotransferase class V-fold PLP-dependent enzyme [Deltaproteobacteria bacterium]|nr:aminotransferase class V-fold PLP-dependent enzyme [Deltaproteobacteria bacterium]
MMIYLDHNATTPPPPEVIDAMLPFLREQWGNPSSLHAFGRDAGLAIDRAREACAALLGAARASEICFTSGGTESDNTAIRALAAADPNKRHIITTAVEHSAVLQSCRALEREGYTLTYLPVARDGTLTVETVAAALRPDTAFATIMWANNETGVYFPIPAIAEWLAARGIPLHVDAVQAVGKLPIDVARVPVSTLAISAHKFHGPKGIGALYVRRGTPFQPLIRGGSQEYGRRAGTEGVPQIVGLGQAATLAKHSLDICTARVRALRDRLEHELLTCIPGAQRNGAVDQRVPNTLNISFPGVDGEGLILGLSERGLCASTGSACRAGSTEPSHVLTAMHLSPAALAGTLRLSLCRYTTDAEIDQAIEIITQVVQSRRASCTH